MNEKESFFINRLKSIGFAFKGVVCLLKTETNIKIQIAISVFVTAMGFYFNISNIEWMLQFLVIGLVMGTEGINTAIEKMADFIHPEKHNKIGLIKDIAAGAVLITSLTAIIIGLIIYIPKIIKLF
ncbi:diacylglycerol kinase family protein [Yeosuana marina]|uniref:diacylglycerol kinase family protein n=1 Tax=Yeosuana marina TaxID=1565536 RepID=UPI001423DF8B|nr:diacylglycerol kinase family protein [Yeosuana marina]